MGKTHQRGTAMIQKDMRARHKRPCISAPSAAANVTLKFKRLHRTRQKVWNGHVKWDPVTTDVAGRDLPKNTDGNARADGYQIEMRATDSSGDVIELPSSQEDPYEVVGGKWQVAGGTTVTKIKQHELRIESSGGIIDSGNLLNLVAGIQMTVNFFARCESGSPTVKFEVWNQTDGSSVVTKNATLTESHHSKLAAHVRFTPSAGKTYRFRATWTTGSGKPIMTKAEYWDAADAMVWKKTAHDEDSGILFKGLERPKVYYYQARVRARSNHHGHRCWSAWSAWTTAINPVTGDEAGGPAIEGLTLVFEKTGKRGNPFRANVTWNEMGWFIPPMGDAEEGAKTYSVKFAQSSDGGSTTDWTHHHTLDARDADNDTTVTAFFDHGIKRTKVYRASVRWQDHDSNWSAWSPWTTWLDPKSNGAGSKPNPVQNLVKTKIKPGVLKWTWDEPSGSEDVDKYRVKVYCQGVLRETDITRAQHYRYHVPKADQGKSHNAKVVAIDHEDIASDELDGGDLMDDADALEEIGTIKQYGGGSAPADWLKCNGHAYTTASPYDLLFGVIGHTYDEPGDPASTFRVPDLRKRHLTEPDDVTSVVGDNDGDDVSARLMTHEHLEDTSNDNELTDTSSDNESTDSSFDNELTDNSSDDEFDDNTNEATHGHSVPSVNTSGPGATTSVAGSGGASVAGPNHTHGTTQHNTNSGAAHKHGHRHGHKHPHQHDHHHGHKHGHQHGHRHGHQHGHRHDNKKRPHLYCRTIIKYQ